MVLKRLDELSISELRTEFVKAGIQGGFQENQVIVILTIHLVSIKEDPFTSQFKSDLSGDESNPEDFEVISEAPKDMLELVVLTGDDILNLERIQKTVLNVVLWVMSMSHTIQP